MPHQRLSKQNGSSLDKLKSINSTADKGQIGEWLLIRHAPAGQRGVLLGRTDDACVLPNERHLSAMRLAVGQFDNLYVSPAKRCVQTAQALFPDHEMKSDDRLWEQNFGIYDGVPFTDQADLGALTSEQLAAHTPPDGESFEDLCKRTSQALHALPAGRSVIVAHAGTVRAGLALVLGSPAAGIRHEVAPLSMTLIRALPDRQFSIGYVNREVGA